MPSLAVSSYTLDQFQPWLTTDQRFSILNSTIRWFPTANNPAIPLPQFRTFAKQRNNEYPEYPFEQRKRNIETKKRNFVRLLTRVEMRGNLREASETNLATDGSSGMEECRKRALPRRQTFVWDEWCSIHIANIRESHNLSEGRW